jgi:hypothetical protein
MTPIITPAISVWASSSGVKIMARRRSGEAEPQPPP